jgi:hypothetical protein
MKKIRSTTELELERMKLKLRQAELEKNIKKDWKSIQNSISFFQQGKTLWKKAAEKFSDFFQKT